MSARAEIGVLGGSGFYQFLPILEEIRVETPFGPPSEPVVIGEVEGHRVAFLPRHGHDHRFPPHRVPYQANLWALKSLGVTRVIAPTAAGSLQPEVKPGEFVIADQLVDRTWGRADTYYDGPQVFHPSLADPYCPTMRETAISVARELGIPHHERGTVVVIQGPRFSTRAESKWYSSQGWEVINMTQYPEAALARELGLCFLNISLITDHDAGLEGHPEVEPVSHEAVLKVFAANNERLRGYLTKLIPALPRELTCQCAALGGPEKV